MLAEGLSRNYWDALTHLQRAFLKPSRGPDGVATYWRIPIPERDNWTAREIWLWLELVPKFKDRGLNTIEIEEVKSVLEAVASFCSGTIPTREKALTFLPKILDFVLLLPKVEAAQYLAFIANQECDEILSCYDRGGPNRKKVYNATRVLGTLARMRLGNMVVDNFEIRKLAYILFQNAKFENVW